jgi:hypothetical protein
LRLQPGSDLTGQLVHFRQRGELIELVGEELGCHLQQGIASPFVQAPCFALLQADLHDFPNALLEPVEVEPPSARAPKTGTG